MEQPRLKMLFRKLDQNLIHRYFDYRDGQLFYKQIRRGRGLVIGKRAGSLNPSGYREVGMDYKTFGEHRVIWVYFNGSIPDGLIVDHINHDRSDNRIENLRVITHKENIVPKRSKAGYQNVRYIGRERYQAVLPLGIFKTALEAATAIKDAKEKLQHHPMESTMTTNGKMASSPRFDELVRAYVELRNKIKEIKERHKLELAKPFRLEELLTEELLEGLASTGQEMARTQYGTVSAAVRVTPSCSDANLFIAYVREHDAYELMDRRPNGTACAEFAKEHGQLPPGVKVNSVRYVNVRAATQAEDL